MRAPAHLMGLSNNVTLQHVSEKTQQHQFSQFIHILSTAIQAPVLLNSRHNSANSGGQE